MRQIWTWLRATDLTTSVLLLASRLTERHTYIVQLSGMGMRDFLKVQLVLLILLAIVVPGTVVAVVLGMAMQAGLASLLIALSGMFFFAWLGFALLRRLGLWHAHLRWWEEDPGDDEAKFEDAENNRSDWLGHIVFAGALLVGILPAIYWVDHFEAMLLILKSFLGEFWAFSLVGPGAFVVWLIFMLDLLIIVGLVMGRAVPPRHHDMRDWH